MKRNSRNILILKVKLGKKKILRKIFSLSIISAQNWHMEATTLLKSLYNFGQISQFYSGRELDNKKPSGQITIFIYKNVGMGQKHKFENENVGQI